jgi:chorismate dehydratase
LTKLRISIVQYLNTAPLVWGFTDGPLQGKYDLSFTVPAQCAEALRTGAVDIAIIPAIEYQRIANLVILPGMAIASKDRVRSLLLLSKKPIEQARSIALDISSRSTQALTKILCDRLWRIAPDFFEMAPDLSTMLARADAALLIGDPALRLAIAAEREAQRGPSHELICSGATAGIPQVETLYIYDVVEEWRTLTELPAVLAVWASRPEIATQAVIEDFQNSCDLGLQHSVQISERAAADLHLPAEDLRRYLTENIDFSLDEDNLHGLAAYFSYAAQMGLIPKLNAVTIAGAINQPVRHLDLFFAKPREKAAI